MIIDPLLFLALLATIIVLAVVMLLLIWKIVRLGGMSRKEDLDARLVARRIIQEAYQKAAAIERSGKFGKEQLAVIIKRQMSDTSEEIASRMKNELEDLHRENIEMTKKASKDIQKKTEEQINAFSILLEEETAGMKKNVQAKIEAAYAAGLADIAKAKESEMQKIKEKLPSIIEEVTKMVLKEGITIKDQEKLVMGALEQAKKEGVFG